MVKTEDKKTEDFIDEINQMDKPEKKSTLLPNILFLGSGAVWLLAIFWHPFGTATYAWHVINGVIFVGSLLWVGSVENYNKKLAELRSDKNDNDQ